MKQEFLYMDAETRLKIEQFEEMRIKNAIDRNSFSFKNVQKTSLDSPDPELEG